MPSPLTFEILERSKENAARTGVVTTPHGTFNTPAFYACWPRVRP